MRKRVQKSFKDAEKLTKQSFLQETNINNIMAKYQATGQITHLSHHPAIYGDFSNVNDLQTAIQQVENAKELFEALPSELRGAFDNNPSKFYQHFENAGTDDLRASGIIIENKQSENPQKTDYQPTESSPAEKPSDQSPS